MSGGRSQEEIAMGHILVVDDEPELIRFVRKALEADGHQVAAARGGADGLRLALEERPDLIVLDLLMPDVDGTAVLRAVRGVDQSSRVLVLSAADDIQARVAALEAGAVDFLAKPFAVRELLARVRRHLKLAPVPDLPADATDGVIHAAGMTLDMRARTLAVDGRVVSLSQREFLLLLHLMRHAGEVCSREELLSEVWGYSFDPSTNIVDVYVGRLRHKMDTDLIRTVRNVGYELEVV
jgi:DNA-binding response OmpR family regulator